MTSRRKCTRTGTEPGLSTKTVGTDNKFSRKWIRHSILSALCLLFLATPYSWAQARGGARQQALPRQQGQNPDGMHITIWSALKTHGVGQHDYARFLGEWAGLLTEHGAVVDGAIHPPTSDDLKDTDVLIIFRGDAGFLDDSEHEWGLGITKATIEEYVKRGGGLVLFHDAVCCPDAAYWSSLVGGAKTHGEVNYSAGPIAYTIVDKSDPIMKDMTDIILWDEAFFRMTWAKDPAIHVLATGKIPPSRSAGDHEGEDVPQIWKYEHTLPGGQPARAFVWMQGHTHSNFDNWQIQRTLLRGISWAAKKPVNELLDYEPPARPAFPKPPAGAASPKMPPAGGGR